MNSFSVIGRLGQDPELKDVGDSQVAEFSIADTQYEGPNRDSTTGWYRCQVWGNRANSVMDFLYKGAQVTVFGSLKQRPYTSKDGAEKISMDIRVNDFSLPPRTNDDNQDEQDEPAPRGRQNERSAPPSNNRQRETSREPVRQGNGNRQQPARNGNGGRAPQRVRDDNYDSDLDDVPF